ncbi:unnamed protein product [Durusdinium trenchii]|uniref:Uncharacterized protein n=2 Tax=Durusdinium trenchii TaxID=1381693 RepID=A0ABP0R583_9DINO
MMTTVVIGGSMDARDADVLARRGLSTEGELCVKPLAVDFSEALGRYMPQALPRLKKYLPQERREQQEEILPNVTSLGPSGLSTPCALRRPQRPQAACFRTANKVAEPVVARMPSSRSACDTCGEVFAFRGLFCSHVRLA